MSKNSSSSIPEKTVVDKLKTISKNETRDWDHIRRNKWWLLLASILLVIFIIWRCPILSFFYRLTGINLVRDCPSKGRAFSLSDLVQNLSTSGAPNSIVVSSPDGTLYSVTTDINGTTVINNLPLPTLNGTSGTNGIDGIDGLNGLPGPAGPIGLTGATGSNGTNGSNGSNGTNGTNGSAGAVGPAGPAGPAAPVPGAPCVGGEYLVWDGAAFVCTLTTNTLVNDGINTMTSTVNGVADSDPIISTNTNSLTQAGGLVNTVNGVVATTAIASAAPTNLLGFDGLGNPVYDFVGDVLADNTTNLLTWTQAGGLSSDVNGAISTVAIAGGTIVNDIGYDAGGTPVRMPRYNWQVGANFGPNYTITDGITWKATSGNNSIQTTNSGGNTTEFDVVISPNVGNSLSALINGLYVPTFLSNAVTSINGETGPAITVTSTDFITTTTTPNTVTMSITPCAAGEEYVYNGLAWACTSSLAYTFQNGLTESPAGIVELGGINPLLHNTDVNTNGFDMTWSNTGRFGIGSAATPELKLDIADDGVHGGGIIARGTFGAGDTITTTGAGTRLMWNPATASFRAGTLTGGGFLFGTEWDAANIGAYSTAFGVDNLASGMASFATGSNSLAMNTGAIAMGLSNTASGASASTAIGLGNTSSGDGSVSLGLFNNTGIMATGSVAIGNSNLVANTSSFGLGSSNNISTDFAGAIGDNNIVSNTHGIALGYLNQVLGDGSYAIGGNMASGPNQVFSQESMIVGNQNVIGAGSEESYLFGQNNTVNPGVMNGFGYGMNNTLSGTNTFAFGYGNSPNGFYGTTVGFMNTTGAGSFYAQAYGTQTQANADYSSTQGFGTTSNGFGQMSIGTFNAPSAPGAFGSFRSSDQDALIIGNGTSSFAQDNAFSVSFNGVMTGWGNDGYPIPVSLPNTGRIYYDDGVDEWLCSENGSVFTTCFTGGTLTAADNGLSLSGTTVQLGQNVGAMGNPGQLLSNREIPYSGFNIVYDPLASVGVTSFGGPAIATKEVSVYGDLLVTGVIDPTALLFSPQTPTSYDPTNPMNNGYRIGVSTTVPSTGMPGTQLPIYVSPLSDNTRVFEVRDAANLNTIFDVDTLNRRAGVRTNNPNSTLQIDGSLAVSYDQATFPTMLDETYQTLVVGPGGSVLLPDATGIVGRIYTIKNESGASITPSTMFGQTIDGIAPTAIEDSNAKWYISDGSNWHSIASFGGGTVTAGAGLTNSGTLSAPILDVLANNGLQVDPVADRVRLGGAVGSAEATNAQLLFNTEVPLSGFNLNWTGVGNMGVVASGTNALERLHVQPGSPMSTANVLFEGMYGSGTTPAFTAYDTTMYWAPGRSAFRAGTATGMQWDNMNVGDYSTAFGLNTTASGMESMAWGENTTASATHATSWGMNTTASGSESTSWGMMSNASGPFATSFGLMTTAMTSGATAWGESSDALGNYSTAWGGANMMGMGPQATGDYATAFGINTIAGGAGTTAATSWGDTTQALASRSTAWGQNTLVTAMATNGTAFGFDTEASGMQATAFGTSTTASGPNSTTWGNNATAMHMQATAFGENTFATGQDSTAFGSTTTASGTNATTWGNTTQAMSTQGTAWGQNTLVSAMATNGTAFGFDTEANGMQSTAFGSSTTANGQDSTAFGNTTSANGLQSTAFGSSTMAMGTNSTAFGLTNFAVGEGTTAWGTTNMAQGDYSTVWGTSTQTAMGATNSTAFGLDTEANALQATSFGFGTTASGINSTSFGDYTDATGISATAWGGGNGGMTGPQATGDYSTAFGITTVANDLGATAWGLSTFATNDYATSWGMGTQATGQSSTAFGMGSQATNTQATAWGQMTTATAINSTAWGMDSDASADQATAWGNMTSASGLNSTTWGDTTIASNDEATAWGNSTIASATSATSFGTGTVANALNATSFGQGSNVGLMGINGTAFGNMTIANQVNATAFGDTTTANGLNSTSFGNLTMASGDNSTAWGISTNASTNQSTAWGNTTNATATNATSFGVGTNATANQSTAFGALTTAAGLNGTAWGQNTTVAMTASNGTAFGDDTDAVGINSTAWGNLTAANGLDATAFGISTIANGDYATAFGNSTQALDIGTTSWGNGSIAGNGSNGGNYSTAFGISTLAVGLSSTSWGDASQATGDFSTSWGLTTIASGIQSTSFGYASFASNTNATAWGENSVASGVGATSWGTDAGAGAGFGSTASGNYSTAFGIRGDASGLGSTSFGNDTTASAQFATAWGDTTTASADNATAWGMLATASGSAATAWGSSTTASSINGTAWGTGTSATAGSNTTAFGETTIASGNNATAWGLSTTAGGELTTSFGAGTSAGGYAATAWGGNDGSIPAWMIPTTANGAFSTAFGFGTSANGFGSTTFGYANTAIYDGTTAWGAGNYSIGNGSTVWGQGNITGVNSNPSTTTYVNDTFMQTILGSYAIRNGNNGDPGFGGPTLAEAVTDEEQLFIIGNGNGIPLDPEERSTAFFVNWTGDMFFERELRTGQDLGTYPDGYAGLAGDVLLSTGSGTASAWTDDDITFWKTGGNTGLTEGSNNRIGTTNEATGIKLIFMTDGVDRGIIDATGKFGIGTLAPVNLLDVEGAVAIGAGYSGTSTAPANGLIVEGNTAIGATSATNRLQVTDAGDDTVASFTGTTQTCTVDTSGGGGWSCSSDQNLKSNISDLTVGLETLSLLRPVSYNWKSNLNGSLVNGFIAQEVEKVLPGLVGNDERGFKTLNMGGMMPIVVKSIQEQQTQITTLSLDMEGLKQEVGSVTSPTPTPEEQSGLLAMITNAINEFFTSVSVAFNKTATFLSGAVFKGRVEFEDTDAGGYATITAGATEVRVDFDKAFAQVPLITANTDDPDLRIGLKDKSESGFTIYMKSATSTDVEITWTALAVKNARRVAGTSTSQSTENHTNETQPTSAPSTNESSTSPSTDSSHSDNSNTETVVVTPTPQPETPTNLPVAEVTIEVIPSETVTTPSPEIE